MEEDESHRRAEFALFLAYLVLVAVGWRAKNLDGKLRRLFLPVVDLHNPDKPFSRDVIDTPKTIIIIVGAFLLFPDSKCSLACPIFGVHFIPVGAMAPKSSGL